MVLRWFTRKPVPIAAKVLYGVQVTGDWEWALRVLGLSLSDISESPSWMGPGSPQSGFLGAFRVQGHLRGYSVYYYFCTSEFKALEGP